MHRKILYKLFYASAIFIGIWLSFFVEPMQSKYGGLIIGVLFANLVLAILLLDRKTIKGIFFDKNDVFLWLYILVMTIGVFLSSNRDLAVNRYFNYAIPILVVYYLFKCSFSQRINKDKIAVGICIIASAVSFIAILEFIFHRNIIYEKFVPNLYYRSYLSEGRCMSTQLVPAVLGTYLLACIPFCYFLIYSVRTKLIRIIGLCAVILCITALFLTFSRGSLFGFVVLSCFYFYKKNKKAIIFLFSFLTLIIWIFSVFGISGNAERFSINGLRNRFVDGCKISRCVTTLKVLKDRPFLGVGLDNYRFIFDKYHYKKETSDLVKIPDNMHMMILGETGMLGYLTFMLFMLFLLKRGYDSHKEIALIIASILIGFLANMVTYDMLYWTVPFYIFWICCGVLASITIEPDKRYA